MGSEVDPIEEVLAWLRARGLRPTAENVAQAEREIRMLDMIARELASFTEGRMPKWRWGMRTDSSGMIRVRLEAPIDSVNTIAGEHGWHVRALAMLAAPDLHVRQIIAELVRTMEKGGASARSAPVRFGT
jgi:hypothetical protein